MEKYLGNKRNVLDSLYNHIIELCPNINSISDLFAGTTNVGRYFRRKGFDIISNDINRFSFVLGQTYLNCNRYSTFKKISLPRKNEKCTHNILKKNFLNSAQKDKDQFFPIKNAEKIWESLSRSASVIAYLNNLTYKKTNKVDPIIDYFTKNGKRAAYKSVRGKRGKRNYFSLNNAQKLSSVLNTIREWWQKGRLSESEIYFLLTSVIEEVVIVANVNGTFHDFNRNRLWPNALQEFLMKVPLTYASKTKASIYCQDAKLITGYLPKHDILYIDPPYNFRQYSAYYHFLNFIAAYPFLPSINQYLDQLIYVRGQHPEDDYTSDFCFRDRFVDALKEVVVNTPSKFVALSYFNGRNHWNHWSTGEGNGDLGFKVLEEFFSDGEYFSEYFSLATMQSRKNYQSREGKHKSQVNEYIFWGKKVDSKAYSNRQLVKEGLIIENNKLLSLYQFCPS